MFETFKTLLLDAVLCRVSYRVSRRVSFRVVSCVVVLCRVVSCRVSSGMMVVGATTWEGMIQ